MARSRRTHRQPFDWMLGCGTFGYLHHADGRDLLIETIRFTEHEAVVINLAQHADRIVLDAWAGKHQFTALTAKAATALAEIPTPVTRKVGDMDRRVDPFHTERYLSPRFRGLVSLIFERRLPCNHGLLLLNHANSWSGAWEGPHIEDPEQTAANISERLARNPTWTLERATREQLHRDAHISADDLDALLARTEWASILPNIDRLVQERHDASPYPLYGAVATPAPDTGDSDDTPQLTLL